MKILVIGQGGREHALAWKLSQSKKSKIISETITFRINLYVQKIIF